MLQLCFYVTTLIQVLYSDSILNSPGEFDSSCFKYSSVCVVYHIKFSRTGPANSGHSTYIHHVCIVIRAGYWSMAQQISAKRENVNDDIIEWKHFPRYWPFVQWPVNSPHKGQWRGALMVSLICAWINAWVNNREASNLRRHRTHYGVIVMIYVTPNLIRLSPGHT